MNYKKEYIKQLKQMQIGLVLSVITLTFLFLLYFYGFLKINIHTEGYPFGRDAIGFIILYGISDIFFVVLLVKGHYHLEKVKGGDGNSSHD